MWTKSSVEFRKSSRSAEVDCVEVASAGPILIRDSKNPHGARLSFTDEAWVSFLAAVRTGVFE